MNNIQWNFNRKSNIFIEENVFENIIGKMAATLSRPQCVNTFQMFTNISRFVVFCCGKAKQLVMVDNKEKMNPPITSGFPSQGASNACVCHDVTI